MEKHFDLIIIGNGLAAHRLLSDLAGQSVLPKSICVIGEEPQPAYNRILLSPLLAAEISPEKLELDLPDEIKDRLVQVTDRRVVAIDAKAQTLVDDADDLYRYEKLVLATGSRPLIPDLEGTRAVGVMAFRTFVDVERIQAAAASGKRAVVVGGGFLGLEAAEGVRKLGMDVTLVHRASFLLNRQLDPEAARLLRSELESRGLTIKTDTQVSSIKTRFNRLQSVELESGEQLEADLLIFAIGIVPNVELAESAGLDVNRGVLVDEQLRTSEPTISALGECVEHQGQTYGLVAPIWRQSEVLAKVLSGEECSYTDLPVSTQLKVSGIDLYSCGAIDSTQDTIFYLDEEVGHYRRFWYEGDRIVGAVMYGDTRLAASISIMIQEQAPCLDRSVNRLFATAS